MQFGVFYGCGSIPTQFQGFAVPMADFAEHVMPKS
jgi:hypothetical protein